MKKCLVAAVVVAVASTAASAQTIEVGNHSRTYTGFSRGFSYTANVDHTIIRLEVPPDSFTAGALASYLVGVNGVDAVYSMGNAGAIAVSVNVTAGDEVLILGNWTQGTPSNFSAANSYSDGSAPYASTITGGGFPAWAADLYRAGFQYDIGAGTASAASSFTGNSGSFGRIWVTVVPAPAPLAVLGLGGLVAIRRRR